RPMEMLLAGTGGCAASDVVLILKRGRQAVTDCRVTLTAARADTAPKVVTKIHFAFLVSGKGLSPAALARAARMSHDKYCTACGLLAQTADITHSIEILEA